MTSDSKFSMENIRATPIAITITEQKIKPRGLCKVFYCETIYLYQKFGTEKV